MSTPQQVVEPTNVVIIDMRIPIWSLAHLMVKVVFAAIPAALFLAIIGVLMFVAFVAVTTTP